MRGSEEDLDKERFHSPIGGEKGEAKKGTICGGGGGGGGRRN